MVDREKQREINDEDADLDLSERIRVIHGEELNGNDG